MKIEINGVDVTNDCVIENLIITYCGEQWPYDIGSSLPSGGKIVTDKQIIDAAPSCPDATELDIVAHNWFINGAKWMQEQYAHQQPPASIEQWYRKWMADRGKSGIATVNILDMLKDFAHQQPVQVQLCPKCNGEGKCFEILIPTKYRVCPVCNGNKILYSSINQQPVPYELDNGIGTKTTYDTSKQPVNDGWEEGYEGAHNFDEDELHEPPKQTV